MIPTVIRVTRYLRPRAGRLNSSPQRPVSPRRCRIKPTNEAVTTEAFQVERAALTSGGSCSADV